MWPDLGKYTTAVLGSYAVCLGLMLGLVALTLWRSKAMKRALAEAEARNLAKSDATKGE